MPNPFLIDPNEDTLREMDEKFIPVHDDRFMYGLQQKKWTIEDVHGFISKLRISYDYTNKEYQRILRLKDTYNLDYPSDHKKYFSTAVELLSKMRCTLSSYKKIIDDFRKRAKRGKKSKNRAKAYDNSPLFTGPYSVDIFGWETYDKSVKDMMNELNDYLQLAGDCLDTCIDIIDEEKAIQSDPDLACPRYDNSFKRSVKANKKLIEAMDKSNVSIDNDLVKAIEDAEDVKQLIASLFHEINNTDFNYFCACKTISDARKMGLTDDELMAFGKENAEKAFRLRILLDHILELAEQRDDVIGWKNMLAGKFVMHVLFWCGWDGSKNETMLKCISTRCQGIIGVVQMGAVMTERRKLVNINNSEIKERQDAFNQDMDAFVDSFLDEKPQKSN